MSKDLSISLLLLLFGAMIAVHCARAARRELRAGVARGFWSHARSVEPIAFWVIIAADILASLMGLFGMCVGIAWLLSL